ISTRNWGSRERAWAWRLSSIASTRWAAASDANRVQARARAFSSPCRARDRIAAVSSTLVHAEERERRAIMQVLTRPFTMLAAAGLLACAVFVVGAAQSNQEKGG